MERLGNSLPRRGEKESAAFFLMAPLEEESPPAANLIDRREQTITLALVGGLIAFFYFGLRHFGPGRGEFVVQTWTRAWNKESDFEHGIIFPFLLLGLLLWRGKEILAARTRGEWLGLVFAVIGAVLFVLAYRTIQWRVAIIGLPFLLTGTAWYLWGRKAAFLLAFPFFLIWLAIPVGFLQQATGGLQLIASKLAHWGSTLCGIPTTLMGNKIIMADGAGFDVDEGCSGIRSLWALMLIAAAWTYAARMALWKKAVFFASVVPIAILGNALRLVSIFVIAKFSGKEFAGGTWHDWSPLVFFYPLSLLMLLTVHSWLEGGVPWKSRKRAKQRLVSHLASGSASNSNSDSTLP